MAVKPILDVPAEEIKIIVTDESGKFWNCYSEVKELYITSEYVLELISKGIIAEKKSKAEIIKENLIEGANKLSEQIIKNDWAKMPKAKQEYKMKEYVLNIDFITLKKGDSVLVGSYTNVHTFENGENKIMLAVPNSCLQLALRQGIIAEKKSKAEEVTDKIIYRLKEDNQAIFLIKAEQAKQIILQELEKAGIE